MRDGLELTKLLFAIRSDVTMTNRAYRSDLVKLSDNEIGCFYEADGYKRIALTRVSLERLSAQ